MTSATRMRWGLLTILCLLSLSLPALLPTFTIQLTIRGLYLGVVAMTFILLAGYADMISLAQMSFAAMAGYVIAIGAVKLGISQWVLFPSAIVGATALSAIFGLVAIRGQGIYFLMMTLALGQLFYGIGMQWVSLTGGAYGYTGLSRPTVLGYSLLEATPLYYVTLVITILSYLALRRVVHSNFGLVLQGIRDNPKRMAALGFNVQLHRYLAIVIFGCICGSSRDPEYLFHGCHYSFEGRAFSIGYRGHGRAGRRSRKARRRVAGRDHYCIPPECHERVNTAILDGDRRAIHPGRHVPAKWTFRGYPAAVAVDPSVGAADPTRQGKLSRWDVCRVAAIHKQNIGAWQG